MRNRTWLLLSFIAVSACECDPVLVSLEEPDVGAGRAPADPRDPSPDAGGTPTDAGSPVPDAGDAPADDAGVDATDAGSDAPDAGSCSPGETACIDGVRTTCEDGTWVPGDPCTVVCTPAARACDGADSTVCSADGTAWLADTSALGCEFYAVVLGPIGFGYFGGNTYALTVTNGEITPATVTVTGGALDAPVVRTVAPQGITVIALSEREPELPFHVTSNAPVGVVQWNPLHAMVGETRTYSCDASTLQPSHTWGVEHMVVSWPKFEDYAPGLLGIVARDDDTTVTITASTAARAVDGSVTFAAGVPTEVTLGAGQYLQLQTDVGDFTGTTLSATRPVQVITGHTGTKIPVEVDAADRLEDALPPMERLSNEAFVVAPATSSLLEGRPQVVRIVAAASNTTLSYDPPQPGAPTFIANAGGFVELLVGSGAYHVQASDRIVVAQYLQSQLAGGGPGDPAMLIPTPRDRALTTHIFHAPIDYDESGLAVVLPVGSVATLDGVELGSGAPIGDSGYAVLRAVSLDAGPLGIGNHTLVCSEPCMISVYGYGEYTSYWHTGG